MLGFRDFFDLATGNEFYLKIEAEEKVVIYSLLILLAVIEMAELVIKRLDISLRIFFIILIGLATQPGS